jgi:hypothetical protein
MYFGDGVYAEFNGTSIALSANGLVGQGATDTVYLEPNMVKLIKEWQESGYCDYNSGNPYEA